MKKYFSWIACGALVLCALIFPNTGTAVAGKGNGRSEKVTSVQEVGEVLQSLGVDLQTMGVSDGKKIQEIVPLKKQFASSDDKEYTSVTVEFDTTFNYSRKMSTASRGVSSSSYVDRTMVGYFTEDSAFYEIEGTFRSKAKGGSLNSFGELDENEESVSDKNSVSIAFKCYMGEEGVFAYFERYVGNSEIPEKALNKWIDMDGDDAAGALSVNGANYEFMDMIGDYIFNAENEDFNKTGNSYVLKDYWARGLCSKSLAIFGGNIAAENFKTAEFYVNLNNKTSPFLHLAYTAKETTGMGSYSYDMETGQILDLRLKNINNTVIKFKVPEKVYRMSDFE